jgi:phosphinothricin acetyltransferase
VTGVRSATPRDVPGIGAIYGPIVVASHISFEIDPPSEAELGRRMAEAPIPWLVGESGGEVVGFASAAPFRERAAYRWTAEMSIYVAETFRRQGLGRELGEALLARLRAGRFRSAVGIVALPNPSSEGLLQALGFRPAGILREAGYKLGRWWDVQLWQRALRQPHGELEQPQRDAERGRGDDRLEDPPPEHE